MGKGASERDDWQRRTVETGTTIDLPGIGNITLICEIDRERLLDPAFDAPDVVRAAIEPAINEVIFDLREFVTRRRPGHA